jgi:molybdenum cofactor cytidylyltransferase
MIDGNPKTAIVILAAGASSRMGKPKSLLDWNGNTLLEFQIKKYFAEFDSIYVVLGSEMQLIKQRIETNKAVFLEFQNWKEGMSSSIAFAVKTLKNRGFEKIIFTPVDQPFVSAKHLVSLLEKQTSSNKGIVQSKSLEDWKGIPVLFCSQYFDELAHLSGDQGAKTLVMSHSNDLTYVEADSSHALMDMDDSETYQKALSIRNSLENK